MRLLARFFPMVVTVCLVVAHLPIALAQQPTNPCSGTGIQPVTLTAVMPTNFSALAKSQIGASCLAWQQFIYLNWQADPKQPGLPNPNATGASFGTPGDMSRTVWESYLDASTVFSGALSVRNVSVRNAAGKNKLKTAIRANWNKTRPGLKLLSRRNKTGDAVVQLGSIIQADGGWLTAQSGGLAYYEVKLNQDEYEFITTNVFSGNDLTTFAGQAACAGQSGQNGKGGFNLPAGNNAGNQDTDCQGNAATYGQNFGAIELKAAWVALPADGSLNYRYKTAQAEITDPSGNKTKATVGLVGLHIIHKLPGAPQFVWATFEQIDNNPDDNNGKPSGPILPPNPNQKARTAFTFFNPDCTPATDPVYQCATNKAPGQPCPSSGTQPPGCTPYTAPMQITRLTPVQGDANSVTAYAWSLMSADSVFNYYRLIDVQWPNQPTPVAPGTTTANMPAGDITPNASTRFVANTTMETFVQNQLSCMSCHQGAPIAQAQQQIKATRTAPRKVMLSLAEVTKGDSAKTHAQVAEGDSAKTPAKTSSSPLASDYSFIFSTETTK